MKGGANKKAVMRTANQKVCLANISCGKRGAITAKLKQHGHVKLKLKIFRHRYVSTYLQYTLQTLQNM
jgi:hypothetical protein